MTPIDQQTLQDLEFTTIQGWLREFAIGPTARERLSQLQPIALLGEILSELLKVKEFHTIRTTGESFPGLQFEELTKELILLPIYPARELPIPGIDSQWLFDKIKLEDKKLVDKDAIFTYLNRESLQVLMTLGAGDIDTLVSPICNWFESEK